MSGYSFNYTVFPRKHIVSRRMISFCAIMVCLPLFRLTSLHGCISCPGELFAAVKGSGASQKNMIASVNTTPANTLATGPAGTAAAKKYLGKDYIDSTIQGAIYLINDAAGTAGVGFRRKEAIAGARGIAGRLKAEASGDPNERYALWKINELEWLIMLEEKDLVLEKMKQGQSTANQLVADYNAEVAKQRPDFRKLTRLHAQMSEISPSQADEMAVSIEKRSRVVSRESMVALEKALMYNDLVPANETFKYCLSNRSFLAFSDTKFEQLEARMSACARSREEFPDVKNEEDKAEQLLNRKKLGEARSVLADANYRLNDIRSFIPENDANQAASRLTRLEGALGRCEDSLVQVNVGILKTKGVDAANQYLQSVLRTAGVSNEKMAGVDQMILAVKSPSSDNSAMQKEIDAVADNADAGSNDVLGEMRVNAIKKAQQKQDSINAVAAKNAAQETQKNRSHAMEIATEIYGLVEKNKPRVAYDFFYNKKQFLQNSLTRDAYAMLEGTVKQVVDPKWETGGAEEIAYLAPVAEPQKFSNASPAATSKTPDANNSKAAEIIAKVYESLEKNDVRGAFQRFDREKPFLRANLDQDAFSILDQTVSSAYQRLR